MKWRLLMIDVCSPPQSTLNWTMFTISANISTINNAFQKSSKNVECGQIWSHRLTDSSDWRNKCYLSINVLIYIKTEEFKELFLWKNVDRRDKTIKTSNVPSSREEGCWRKVLFLTTPGSVDVCRMFWYCNTIWSARFITKPASDYMQQINFQKPALVVLSYSISE